MALFGWEGLKKLGVRPQPNQDEIGSGPATKCEKCGEILLKKILEDNLGVCPHAKCGHHHRLSARQRIAITLDTDSFEEMDAALATRDILEFRGPKTYMEKLREAQKETGLKEAAITGLGRLAGRPVAFGVTDSAFIMGSMGSVVGEKLTRLIERAIAERLPLILISGSGGGARMYEGLFSLMQMAKTSAALGRLREAGLPFISICTDCTMAGVWASWASLGDIIIAEPKALIGFTGPRVIKTTINVDLPPGFQLSEFLLEHGQIDMILPRPEIKPRLASLLDLLQGEKSG